MYEGYKGTRVFATVVWSEQIWLLWLFIGIVTVFGTLECHTVKHPDPPSSSMYIYVYIYICMADIHEFIY